MTLRSRLGKIHDQLVPPASEQSWTAYLWLVYLSFFSIEWFFRPVGAIELGLIVLTLAVIFRALVVECLDPLFLRGQSRRSGWVHSVFLGLLVLNLTAGFQTLGTLMAVGLMMLPATSARFWSKRLEGLIGIAVTIAMIASTGGLLLSFHLDIPSGPSIILLAGSGYLFSALFGRYHSLAARWRRKTAPLSAEPSA